MKILWVKSGGLLPPDTGGKIRSLNLLRELAKLHAVDLFTFYPRLADDPHHTLGSMVSKAVYEPMDIAEAGTLGDYAHYARNLLSSRPYSAAKYCRPEIAQKLRAWLEKQRYDLILCDFLLTAGVIPWDVEVPKVIFTHNVEAQIWKRHFQVSKPGLWKAVAWREFKTMDAMERRYLRLADGVLTVSENDKTQFSEFVPRERLAVIPTGVDIDYFRPQAEGPRPNTLVFTGSMDWTPNQDAILYFAEAILPKIQKELGDASLWVVGRKPSERLKELARKLPGIHVTGAVDDIRPYIARSAVYVVPIRIGGGTRIKIYEAMAMGKPVVSTTVGAEGLPVENGRDLFLEDDPERFAAVVVQLLRSPRLSRQLGEAARRLVETSYSWAAVAGELAETLERFQAGHAQKDELAHAGR